MPTHGLDGFQQVSGCVGLYNVTLGPGAKSFPQHLRRIVLRHKQNLKVRLLLPDLTANFNAAHLGHGHIQNQYIRLQTPHFFQSLNPVRRLAHYFAFGPPQ